MKLKRLSLLFLLISSGCVVQTLNSTSPQREGNNTTDIVNNNFNVLTEVTAIPTKKPWEYIASPSPVPMNDYANGSAYVDLNIDGFRDMENNFGISNVVPSLGNVYFQVNRKARRIELSSSSRLVVSFSESYNLPPEPHNPQRPRNVNHSFSGTSELEVDKDSNVLRFKAVENPTAGVSNSQLRWGGGICTYWGLASSSLIPSGSLEYINGKFTGSLSYRALNTYYNTDNGCSWHGAIVPGLISGNASINVSVSSSRKPPVDIEIKVPEINGKYNEIISPANQDGKYDIAKLLITTMSYDDWVLIAEGKDIYGNTRRYMEEGKGNKDIDFKGKTNDAIDSKQDMYFADGEVKITLTSKKSGESSSGIVYIDNTPPEIKVNNISMNGTSAVVTLTIIDKFPDNIKLTKTDRAVSGLDETSIPRSKSLEGISINKQSENNYNVTFSSQMSKDFEDNLEGLKQTAKYATLTALYEKTSDKVINIDECEYKDSYLNLLQNIIELHQKKIIDQSDEISIEEKKEIPNISKINDLENKIEQRIIRLEVLREKLINTAKRLKCWKDDIKKS